MGDRTDNESVNQPRAHFSHKDGLLDIVSPQCLGLSLTFFSTKVEVNSEDTYGKSMIISEIC